MILAFAIIVACAAPMPPRREVVMRFPGVRSAGLAAKLDELERGFPTDASYTGIDEWQLEVEQ